MKRIYVDIDDVLADTCSRLLCLSSSMFGIKKERRQIASFDMQVSLDLTRPQYDAYMTEFHRDTNLLSIKPIPGAVEGLHRIREAFDLQVYIVTGRPPSTRDATVRWLDWANVQFDKLLFVDKYSRYVEDVANNSAISLQDLADYDFDLAIEDSATTAEFLANSLNIQSFVLAQPWNESARHRLRNNPKIYWVEDWSNLENEIISFSNSTTQGNISLI
jgi:uncharacterized HAD superfamily protein